MATDNAPHAVNQPPYPNIVCPVHSRITLHVATITGANGSAAVNQSRSTAGISVTYVSEGIYTINFPALTGAIGWAQVCPPQVPGQTKTDVRMYAIDSDTVDYAAGRVDIVAVDASDTAAPSDIIGAFTVLIYQVAP